MTHTIRGRDLIVGDRVVRFTNDVDVIVTDIDVMESGGIMLTLDVVDVVDVPGDRVVGSTYYITDPDATRTVDRP